MQLGWCLPGGKLSLWAGLYFASSMIITLIITVQALNLPYERDFCNISSVLSLNYWGRESNPRLFILHRNISNNLEIGGHINEKILKILSTNEI